MFSQGQNELWVIYWWFFFGGKRGAKTQYFTEYHRILIVTMEKQRRKIKLPSANPWEYLRTYQHVPESSKLQKDEIPQLQCRTTHCVSLQEYEHNVNDGLYSIYGYRVGQSPEFMRDWLHYFITTVYKTHFKRIGLTYLTSKGLSLELWAESIKNGRQPDFFVLLALNALLETHAAVHISNNRMWTTLNDPPGNHDSILEHCEYHLVYLGNGNFIELVKRQRPLIVVHTDEDIKTVEIGSLTFDEEETLNSVISKGLDITSKSKSKSALHAENTSSAHCLVKQEPLDSVPAVAKEKQPKRVRRRLVVKLHKLATDSDGNVILTEELKRHLISPSGYDSDETIIYNFGGITPSNKLKLVREPKKPKLRKSGRSATRSRFDISVYGIKRKKKRTYIACKIPGCSSKFPSVREWNSHHRLVHRGTLLKCNVCMKKFNTPSFLRDHAYVHSKSNYKCEKCDKNFPFKSLYRIHVRTHLRSKIYKCFAGSCNKEYKWPQDLHRHILTHLQKRYNCNMCDYSNTQNYLLKRHLKKHSDKTNYECELCEFKCKWYTQLKRHLTKCTISKTKKF